MAISVFDLFKVGIGPSSSHTVGPMKAARLFVTALNEDSLLARAVSVRAELFGSLGATGHGHGSDKAVLLGLEGEDPETVDTHTVDDRVRRIRETGRLRLLGVKDVDFRERDLHRRRTLPFHPNGMRFQALDHEGGELRTRTYYSVGGGFVVDETASGADRIKHDDTPVRLPFHSASELLLRAYESGLPLSGVMLANELSWRSESEVRAGLLRIWTVMRECVDRGCSRTETTLPGRLKVGRREGVGVPSGVGEPEGADTECEDHPVHGCRDEGATARSGRRGNVADHTIGLMMFGVRAAPGDHL